MASEDLRTLGVKQEQRENLTSIAVTKALDVAFCECEGSCLLQALITKKRKKKRKERNPLHH